MNTETTQTTTPATETAQAAATATTPAATTATDAQTPKKKKTINKIPTNLANVIISTRDMVGQMRKENLEFKHTSNDEIETSVNDLEQTYLDRKNKGAKKSPNSSEISTIKKQQNFGASKLKFKLKIDNNASDAIMKYAEFGFEKTDQGYLLPNKPPERLLAIERLIPALTVHGLEDFEYGKTFWTNTHDDLSKALSNTRSNDGDISQSVSKIKTLAAKHKKLLNCGTKLIAAHYPDDTAAQLRNFGFQKEKNK